VEIDDRIAGEIPETVSELFAMKDDGAFLEAFAPALAKAARADVCRVVRGKAPAETPDSPGRVTVMLEGQGSGGIFVVLERTSPSAEPMTEGETAAIHFLGELVSDEWRRRTNARKHAAGLSRREREIANLVVWGTSNQEVALRLGISVETVKRHLYNIYNKTGAESRTHLAIILRDGGRSR